MENRKFILFLSFLCTICCIFSLVVLLYMLYEFVFLGILDISKYTFLVYPVLTSVCGYEILFSICQKEENKLEEKKDF
ncbi:MAG: hypothetical protein J6C82_04330 [Clostridia bacterium]|nr:hypothetical protein [Clostridia bacterium]